MKERYTEYDNRRWNDCRYIGSVCREYRKLCGITIRDMSEYCKVSMAYISKFEHGGMDGLHLFTEYLRILRIYQVDEPLDKMLLDEISMWACEGIKNKNEKV